MAQHQASLEYLSYDEMYNILKRVRAEKLCKMSILSSTWKVLIKDPNLINLHCAWSKMHPLVLIITQPSVQNQTIINDSEETDPLMLTSVDPADGTVTFQVKIRICKDDVQVLSSGPGCLFCIVNQGDFIIFNATTKVIQTLPTADDPPLGIAAGFGSIRSRRKVHLKPILPFVTAVGFGYIKSRHVYAVIKLFLSRSCQIIMLSETGEINSPWRTLDQKYSPSVCPGNNGIIVGNKCYWMNRNIMMAKLMRTSPAEMSILCLDVESETFYDICYPKFATCDELVDNMQLGDLKDELFFGYSHGDPLVMDVWVLKDLQNSDWSIQYRVDLYLIGGIDDHVLTEVKVIGYWEVAEQGGVLMFHDSRQQMLLYYNVEEKSFKRGKRIQIANHVSNMFPYSERFSSIRRPAR